MRPTTESMYPYDIAINVFIPAASYAPRYKSQILAKLEEFENCEKWSYTLKSVPGESLKRIEIKGSTLTAEPIDMARSWGLSQPLSRAIKLGVERAPHGAIVELLAAGWGTHQDSFTWNFNRW